MTGRRIRAAVFDIDGTLALMDKASGTFTALPGAVAALAGCRARGVAAVAYTNGTFFPRRITIRASPPPGWTSRRATSSPPPPSPRSACRRWG